ncbi:30S ribosomal protein S17 [Litorilinea aerophila]|uniref:Small ribosomal subunit protein uS17 n=1 Tax=Litorilinea aerophila TaxID=1204385 RepID=A0A540VHQ7_9CHLR|nr:30S ribosomal protein S17 [Litorilinea aerophila]MCC9075920.1 30S ribosomal protein S17 [Litorilinea aerophila]OUC07607.1 30S ribosomal protein S17 [Litorilinea aerophila]GIV78722.1 MAG: 30S ribosomal protein S17 [Litorilinea sp.]
MRERRRTLVGVVTSDKMDKTVVVTVQRITRHPLYGKVIKVNKKYKAHDENNEAREGDLVRICECRPISKEKKFFVQEILERADVV